MKVCFISDLHGDLLDNIKECELVCIYGDISPLKIQGNKTKMRYWLTNQFKVWANNLPCEKILFIAGNHDWFYQNLDFMYSFFPKAKKVTYLFHEEYKYISKENKEYRIFGTPYCKLFGNWAFMELDSYLEKLYDQIPEGLDLLLTHDSPYGISDIILQHKYFTGEHIGNKPLAEAILKKEPKFVAHGHLHSTNHEIEYLGNSKVFNCSIKDEDYKIVYDPIYIEL